jgi:hypothetical protein
MDCPQLRGGNCHLRDVFNARSHHRGVISSEAAAAEAVAPPGILSNVITVC